MKFLEYVDFIHTAKPIMLPSKAVNVGHCATACTFTFAVTFLFFSFTFLLLFFYYFSINLPINPLVSFLLLCLSLPFPEKIPVPQSATDPSFKTEVLSEKCSDQASIKAEKQYAE